MRVLTSFSITTLTQSGIYVIFGLLPRTSKAVTASYKGGYKIEVTFEDGAGGIVDFEKYLEKGGEFNKFKDIDFFKRFSINEKLGVLTWGDEIDIAP